MKKLIPLVLPFAILASLSIAQDIANHSMPIGGGPGATGWKTGGPCAAGQALVWSGIGVDPQCTSVTGTGSTPGGADTNVQFNNAGTFGGLTNAQLAARTIGGSNTQIQFNNAGVYGGLTDAQVAGRVVGGSTTQIQINNAGVFGSITDATLAGRITSQALTWTNVQKYSSAGHVFFGSGRPWIDVMSGANGCAAAVGNNTTDDNAAIQCQLNYINTTLGGGYLYFPRTGGCFRTSATLTVYPSTTIVGSGMNSSCIWTNNVDVPALAFIGGSNAFNGMRDIIVEGSLSTTSTQSVVYIDDNTPVIFANVWIRGGYRAIINHGVDGRFYHVYAAAAATTVGSANLFSRGSNFYTDCKFDSTSAQDFGVFIYAPYTSSASVMENQFVNTDFSGPFGSAAFAVDDSVNPSRQAVTKCLGCIFGGSIIINGARWTALTTGELGPIAHNNGADGGVLTIGNSLAFSSVTVSGTGSTRLCSNNFNVTC